MNKCYKSLTIYLWLYTTDLFPKQTLYFILCFLFAIILLEIVYYRPLHYYFIIFQFYLPTFYIVISFYFILFLINCIICYIIDFVFTLTLVFVSIVLILSIIPKTNQQRII